jgi:ribosome-associated protein
MRWRSPEADADSSRGNFTLDNTSLFSLRLSTPEQPDSGILPKGIAGFGADRMVRPRHLVVEAGSRRVVIPADALEWQFARSAGPGGQHVNRTSSKAVLRFRVTDCPFLPDDVRTRLLARERSRLTLEGELIVTSQRNREQPRNVADCLAKLSALIERAILPPKSRRPTRVPRSARAARLEAKKRRGSTKRLRQTPSE